MIPIQGFESHYLIDEFGKVYSYYINDYLKVGTNGNGRPTYTLTDSSGCLHHKSVYRLVAEHFIPNPDNLPCINHLDGDKMNSHVSNLEWCTYQENMIHARNTGLIPVGESVYNRKLTSEIVAYCREVHIPRHKEFSGSALAKRFGVDKVTMSRILRGKSWVLG